MSLKIKNSQNLKNYRKDRVEVIFHIKIIHGQLTMDKGFLRKSTSLRLIMTLKKENSQDGLIGQYNHTLTGDVFGNIHLNFQKTLQKLQVATAFKGIKMEKLLLFLNLEINYIILSIILIKFKLLNLKNLKA